MPRRVGPVTYMETLPVEQRLAEPSGCQRHWYQLAGSRCRGLSVLDAGAGTGYGLDILKSMGASEVRGIDPLPLRPEIVATPISEIPDKSYDVVVACDVIEHIEDDEKFFSDMLRVARKFVFVSTPNWDFWHAENLYHVREYTPAELRALVGVLHRYEVYTSNHDSRVRRITDFDDNPDCNFGVMVYLDPT